ncbi:MAG: DUF86 domain-containing protein [Chthoniobacterales bacterium]
MSARAARERLTDILDSIEAIRRYTGEGRERFDTDELVRVWCLRHIEIIGEAASKLPTTVREKYSEVPWKSIIAMRNILIHGYDDVEDDPESSTAAAVVARYLERKAAEAAATEQD